MSNHITEEDISSVKKHAQILDVVQRFVSLKKSGKSYKGRCPFHQEKTPSFFVSPDRGTYKCFGCGSGGDSISFVRAHEGLTFNNALYLIASYYGLELGCHDKFGSFFEKPDLDRVEVPMWRKLAFPGKKSYRKGYDFDRNPTILSHSNIDLPSYFLPLGDDRIQSINRYVEGRGFSIEDLRAKGYGGCITGSYSDRLVIPCYISGVLAYWQARDIADRDRSDFPKFRGPSGISSGNCIYNIDRAQHHEMVVAEEGAFDAERTGDDAAGMYGCSITSSQLLMLQVRKVKHVCLCFDPDAWVKKKVGRLDVEAPVMSSGRVLLNGDIRLNVAILTEGDPDEIGTPKTREAINASVEVGDVEELEILVAKWAPVMEEIIERRKNK